MVTLAVTGGVPEFTFASTFFGIGAALVLDEFALILHLSDVYWARMVGPPSMRYSPRSRWPAC